MPFGKNRSSFNPTLRKRFVEFANHIRTKDLTFTVEDFKELDLSLTPSDFVYCDPPYLNTTATYNEQGGWNEDEERALLRLLDGLNEINVRFALSNVFESKGIRNEILIEWAEKYNVKYLDYSYSNANYQVKDRTAPTVEVLVTNY